MTFVSWAVFHEGPTDGFYLEVLLPRLIETIIAQDGVRNSDVPAVPAVTIGKNSRRIDDVASEICDAKDAFELIFSTLTREGGALNVAWLLVHRLSAKGVMSYATGLPNAA